MQRDNQELTVPDAKRRYLQGKVQLRLYQYDDARPFLETARQDLIMLGNYPRDVFSITLDLTECCLGLFKRPWKRVLNLLSETFAICQVRNLHPESEAAIELLHQALQAHNLNASYCTLDAVRQGTLE